VNDRFNLSAWALRHRALVLYLMVMVAVLGALSYTQLSQSEDPPFTFKVMVIQARWPGATARQIQEEVTDRIARKLQETPNVDFLRSYSRPGETQIFFNVRDSVPAADVPNAWYQVRKKVGDIAAQLPPGLIGPFFNDEFGDVYTNLYALEGDGYSFAQLHDYAEDVRAELLRVRSVAKVDLIADQSQRVYIEIDNARIAQLGLSVQALADALGQQNAMAGAGSYSTGSDRIFVRPSGQFDSVESIRDLVLRVDGRTIRLGDIATVRRGYDDPPSQLMRVDGQSVLGMGVTMQPGTDVIELGKSLEQTVATIGLRLPAGLKLATVTSMPRAVKRSVDDFAEAVAEAIGIVLLVSLLSLGLRTGMVVVIAIPFVLAVTAWLMKAFDVGLHKVSLGTLVLALGLLVDDAIIAVEMMKVKLEQGWDRTRAAAFAYDSTAFPMLTGTLVTTAGFLPIALARSGTGEYTRSIFEVSAIALIVSWFAAVIVIPLLGYYLLPQHGEPLASAVATPDAAPGARPAAMARLAARVGRWRPSFLGPAQPSARLAPRKPQRRTASGEPDVYDTPFYDRLRGLIDWCVRRRWVVLLFTLAAFGIAMAGFGSIPKQFFPSSDRPELLVDLRLPEGASIEATLALVKRMEALLGQRGEIENFASFVGSGAPRFYLPLDQQLPQPNFAQFLVTTHDVAAREALAAILDKALVSDFSAAHGRITRLESGPPVGFPVRFRVQGSDIATVRGIAEKVLALMRAEPRLSNVQLDWDEPAERSVRLQIDQDAARRLNVSTQDLANFLNMTLSGLTVTQYRERDKLIAVDLRAPAGQRLDPSRIDQLTLRTPSGATVPLGQLVQVHYGLEYAVIWERDRLPTITVQSDTIPGAQPIDVTGELDRKLADIRAQLPFGYHIEIGGATEENGKAQSSINAQMPVMALVVLTLLMIQMQSVSRVLMVVLTAPLGLVGVVIALLLFGKPFGFVALLGIIAMFGIIMRNSVILVDQIEQDIKAGAPRWEAIVGATVRRFRPITLTAAAAVLALIPLLRSNFFGPMATALMGGITVATILTLFYLPALYAAWFRVRSDESPRGASA
jgi:multidrug efflux pump subunit AcrB